MPQIGDGLDHLRIPLEKIKFNKSIEFKGYGSVSEGNVDDQKVALKRLNITNLGHIKPTLLAEILTISRFRQHPNLVALLGFCDEKSSEIILVYEYVANGTTLSNEMRKHHNTIQRIEICLGAARGLDYLHTGFDPTTPGIVHGRINLSNVLLDFDSNSSKFVAKVSNFGLSKIIPGTANVSRDEDAEKPTKMSDVYSFGVLLLEVLCGVSEMVVEAVGFEKRHVTQLVPMMMKEKEKLLRKIVHHDIQYQIKTEALETYARIACQCVIQDPQARPTMAQVVQQLEKALILQGGEVSYDRIPGGKNVAGAPAENAIKEGPKSDVNILTTEDNVKDVIAKQV